MIHSKVITHVSRRTIVFVLCIVALAAVLTPGAMRWYSLYEQERAYTFYSSALHDARIPPRNVAVSGIRYTVQGGVVTTAASSSISRAHALKALELTYEMAVAERSPQFGLAGTEPDKLDTQVTELARVQKEQADSLRIPSNIEAVRTSLYPISFLRALAAVERARLAFIGSGSDTAAVIYRAAISSVIEAQRHDSELFGASYKFLGYKDAKFPLLGGTMTSGNVEKAIAAIRSSAGAQAAILSKRDRCFSGVIRACDVRDIALPLPPSVSDTHDARAARLAGDVEEIYWGSRSNPEVRKLVALSSSTCLASVAGPYIFRDLVPEDSISYLPPALLYMGDVFFSTSTASLATLTNGRMTPPVTVQSAMYFYECADSGLDVSQVNAVELVASFAQVHPTIAPQEREKLLSTNMLHEDDAVEYLRSALQSNETYPRDAEQRLTGLALMFRDKSAALDVVVHEVWMLSESNLRLIRKGYQYDDSLLFFFGSHSAFPTLFQLYNPSVVKKSVSIYDRSPGALTTLSDMLLRYSARPEYRADIAQTLRGYRLFEYDAHD